MIAERRACPAALAVLERLRSGLFYQKIIWIRLRPMPTAAKMKAILIQTFRAMDTRPDVFRRSLTVMLMKTTASPIKRRPIQAGPFTVFPLSG
jgi:hypothetical protein